MKTCADCRVKDCCWYGDREGAPCGFLRMKRSRVIVNIIIIAIFIALLAAVVASAIGTAVNEGREAWEPQTNAQIVSTAEIRDVATGKHILGYEPSVVAQYLSDGTSCVITAGSQAVWVDRFGERHEVPTLYVAANGPHKWWWDGSRFVASVWVSGEDAE